MKVDPKVIAFFPCRNEAKNLGAVLESMNMQTYPFYKIVIVDDNSTDETSAIAEEYGAEVMYLPFEHPSYLGKPELSTIFNMAIIYILANKFPYNYLMQHGADNLLPAWYVECMVKRMEEDKRIVIAGGNVKGEAVYKTHVRGTGRFYRGTFWNRWIRFYPFNHAWESYPLFKALSLGLITRNYKDLIMIPLRPTRLYKEQYGIAMRELGYFPPFAFMKCLLTIFLGRKFGVKMLNSYLLSKSGVIDEGVKAWIRRYQVGRMIHFKESLEIWIWKALH
jgi:glycosyltransferase involved in cell wall biosynthesis